MEGVILACTTGLIINYVSSTLLWVFAILPESSIRSRRHIIPPNIVRLLSYIIMAPLTTTPLFFSTFPVTSQAFYLTTLSFALVNLKPLAPGHVLISPRRVVPRFHELSPAEVADLFLTAQRVSGMIRRVYDAPAVNIAVQDGVEAGQTVPHVHAHVIPRRPGDFGGQTDRVYDLLQAEEGDVGKALRGWMRIEEHERQARAEDDMRKEAERLAAEMEKEVAS